ncbi:hypothetical protein A2U01_0002677, partial [Trifolium medium]|nr:hypothetical protein [Trifolium medium]
DLHGDCPVWGSEDEEFFPVGMGMVKEVPPKEGSAGMRIEEEYSPKRGIGTGMRNILDGGANEW